MFNKKPSIELVFFLHFATHMPLLKKLCNQTQYWYAFNPNNSLPNTHRYYKPEQMVIYFLFLFNAVDRRR